MPTYLAADRSLALGPAVGQGGEATVYQVSDRPGLLAKIYTAAPRPGYDQKLAWMKNNPPQDPTQPQGHASIAWPQTLVYDQAGRLSGYLMPYIPNAVSLLEVFNPRRRTQTLPGFNGQYLHRTARNLAIALEALHTYGYVVGDLNESNILVTPTALVTLIDTDSFQIEAEVEGEPVIFPCPVGKPEYTPPELQGKSFKETPRRPEHDRFGLGVLLFQLLMSGNHPYRAQWLGPGEPPPLEDRIRLGCFPYGPKPACPVAPPRHAPGLDRLHLPLAELFRTCFVAGDRQPDQRPTPAQWADALAAAEAALIECSQGHYYADHLPACPRCASQPAVRPPGQPTRPLPTGRPRSGPGPLIRPIVSTPPATPISAQKQPSPPSRPDRRRWWPWLVVLGLILAGGGLWASLAGTPAASQLPTPPPATPRPTFTATPVQVVILTPPSPTETPSPTPPPTATVLPTDTPLPPPPATATATPPPPPPTATTIPEEPEIFIVLPDGTEYNRGDSIEVVVAVQDPNGVGTVYWWVTNADSRTVILQGNHWCENRAECVINQRMADLSRGRFNLFVAAFDTQQKSQVVDTQIVVQ